MANALGKPGINVVPQDDRFLLQKLIGIGPDQIAPGFEITDKTGRSESIEFCGNDH
jgi:hypothetical protein